MPADRGLTECVVVLHRARRPGRAVRGDVDLLGDMQLPPQVIGEQAGQSGAHRRSDDQHCGVATGQVVEIDEHTDVGDVGRRRHHRDSGGEVLRSQLRMWMRMAQTDHIGDCQIGRVSDGDDASRRGRHCRIEDSDPAPTAEKVGSDAAARDPIADQADDRRTRIGDGHVGGSLSSRQPPSCGGMPPLPRTRNTPAIAPARERATKARRSAFTVGLAGIEPATFTLSV